MSFRSKVASEAKPNGVSPRTEFLPNARLYVVRRGLIFFILDIRFDKRYSFGMIIAEIGTAHGGSLAKARKLIDAAFFTGADAVKFQWVYADEILHPDTGTVDLPGGKIKLYDRFKALEVPSDFF